MPPRDAKDTPNDATCYGQPSPHDPDATEYPRPPQAGDTDATRYAAESADPDVTGYTPTSGGARAPSDGRLPRRFAGYELLEEIGHGGMGVVYKARQLAPERIVALKMIRAGELATEEDTRRFRQEANEAALLDHPHIVPIYEVGEHDGRRFFSMKLIEGGSLARHLDRYRGDPKAAARLVAAVARAVHHAHQRQILHRDLKPGNVLIDGEGQPYVADFGLAKRLGGAGEASQSVGVGTPEYMAPEQARGDARLTTAADVYALGGILYALLTGRPPFRGETPWATIAQVQSQAPVAPSRHHPGCPRDLETICLKCLDKEPAKRYGSAEALAEDLERWLKGLPVVARPIGKLQRLWRWSRRNPGLAGTLAALVLVLLGSLAGMTALYLHAEQQRRMAEHREEGERAVTQFYQENVLRAARPKGWSGGAGKDVTLKDALDQAAAHVDEAFQGQPRLEASVRNTLGMTYWYLGLFNAAGPHLEKAYRIRKARLGEDHPDTLTSLHCLAMLRWKQGKVDTAVPLWRQALEGRRRVLGPEHEDTLWTQLHLGSFLWELDERGTAEAILREAIQSCKHILGPEHPHTLYGQHDLAICLWEKGEQEEAERLCRLTLEGRERVLGPDHPDTLRTMGRLGGFLADRSKFKEAEALCRKSLESRRRILGPEHLETLWSEWYLGNLLGQEGKYAEAENILRHSLEVCRRSLGLSHPDTLDNLATLGEVLSNAGRPDAAEPLLRECLTGREKKLSRHHWRIGHARSLLGGSLSRQTKFTEAEPLVLAGYEGLAKGAPVKQIANALDRVVELYEKWGKPDQAEAWRKKRPAPPAR